MRHRRSLSEMEDCSIVAEDNEAMLGTYAMIDPIGRVYKRTFALQVLIPFMLGHWVHRSMERSIQRIRSSQLCSQRWPMGLEP